MERGQGGGGIVGSTNAIIVRCIQYEIVCRDWIYYAAHKYVGHNMQEK